MSTAVNPTNRGELLPIKNKSASRTINNSKIKRKSSITSIESRNNEKGDYLSIKPYEEFKSYKGKSQSVLKKRIIDKISVRRLIYRKERYISENKQKVAD